MESGLARLTGGALETLDAPGLDNPLSTLYGDAEGTVRRHDGRIWVESQGAGKGSTFCFTLGPVC